MHRNSRPSARERATVLEQLRERQIQTLAKLLEGDPQTQTDTPSVQVVGALIAQLSEAIKVVEERADRSRDRRLALVVIGGAVLLVGTFLFLPLRSTPVSIETKSRSLSFTVADSDKALLGGASATSLELSGIGRVYRGNDPVAGSTETADSVFKIASLSAGADSKPIGLSSFALPAGTRVEIVPAGSAEKVELILHFGKGTPAPSLSFDVEGDFTGEIAQDPAPSFAGITRLEAFPRTSNVVAVLGLNSRGAVFDTLFRAAKLSWPNAIEESSIVSGKVALDEFPGRSATLRKNEPLRIGNGLVTLRSLALNAGIITCSFDGTVNELSTGSGDRRRNLMPTWLSWLRTRDAVLQFWAAFVALVSLALGIRHWWSKPE